MLDEVVPKPETCLPLGPKVAPFGGSYLESYKGIPKKELLWGLWVGSKAKPSSALNRGTTPGAGLRPPPRHRTAPSGCRLP